MRPPALVVSPAGFNKLTQDVVPVAITSQPSDSHVVALREADHIDGDLPLASSVENSKLVTMHPTLVFEKVSAIWPTGLDSVLQGLRGFLANTHTSAASRGARTANGRDGDAWMLLRTRPGIWCWQAPAQSPCRRQEDADRHGDGPLGDGVT